MRGAPEESARERQDYQIRIRAPLLPGGACMAKKRRKAAKKKAKSRKSTRKNARKRKMAKRSAKRNGRAKRSNARHHAAAPRRRHRDAAHRDALRLPHPRASCGHQHGADASVGRSAAAFIKLRSTTEEEKGDARFFASPFSERPLPVHLFLSARARHLP